MVQSDYVVPFLCIKRAFQFKKNIGKAANILVGVESRNMTGDVVLFNQVSLFLLGKGGWGGQKSSSCVIKTEDIPCRKPDFSKEYK